MNTSTHVRIVEVGARDGLQNEKTLLPAAVKIALIDRLSATGLKTIEATSFVSPKWVPQLADAAEVYAGIRKLPGVSYPVLVPNLTGYQRAREVGATHIAVFTAASEAFNRRNINASIDESIERFIPVLEQARADGVQVRGYVSTVLGCPYQGEVPRWRCISTTPTARRWRTSWPAWRKACAWWTARSPAPAAAPTRRAPPATWPARTWSTCCTA